MNTFDYAVLLAAVAGLVMVIGGVVLIYKGAIVLASTDSGNALSIEWKQSFRLNTQVPGIAFFIVGLIFSCVSIYASKPTEIEPITIEGEVVQIPEQVTIRARSSTWTLHGGTNGVVKGRVYPHVEDITLEISAPGYRPESITFNLSELDNRKVQFDAINLKQLMPAIEGLPTNITDIPSNVAPVSSNPSFGVAQ